MTLLTPASELERRVAAVQKGMVAEDIELALIVQNADLYYLAGTVQPGYLALPAEGEPVLLVQRNIERARAESALSSIKALSGLRQLPEVLAIMGLGRAPRTVGLELDVLPVVLFRRFEALFPSADFKNCSNVLREARSIKSPFELSILAEAAARADRVMHEAARVLREGMTEVELSSYMEAAARRTGHQGLVRFRAFNQELLNAHVYAGPEATLASYSDTPLAGRGMTPAVAQGAGERPIRRGEPVVVDFVATAHGYGVDQARVLSIGPLPPDLAAAYGACRRIEDAVVSAARPGVTCGELYRRATELAAILGYSDSFMGAGSQQAAFIGHGLGLEIDELPVVSRGSARPLAEGNVLALEPKLVFPGRAAVGVENTWHVGAEGLEKITISSEEIWEV